MAKQIGRPKTEKGQEPRTTKTISMPISKQHIWEELAKNCKEMDIPVSKFLLEKIAMMNQKLKESKEQKILQHTQQSEKQEDQ